MSLGSPSKYSSMAEFEREEISRYKKAGWSLDDLYEEAAFRPAKDDSLEEEGPKELDFG